MSASQKFPRQVPLDALVKMSASQETIELAERVFDERETRDFETLADAYEQALRRIAGPCEGDRFDGSCLDFVDDPGWCAPCVATAALVRSLPAMKDGA